jgi:hypothetical protein
MSGLFGDGTRQYDTPLDVGFLRDIDPTVLPGVDDADPGQGPRSSWVLGPEIIVETATESALSAWPFRADPGLLLKALPDRTDGEGHRWTTLYEHRHATQAYESEHVGEHGMRQQEFRFLACVLVKSGSELAFAQYLSKKREIDISDWDPISMVDGAFLLEAPWRDTWPRHQWTVDGRHEIGFAFPVYEYHWESHLDASLPEGCRAYVPAPWLISQLGLMPHRQDASAYVDANHVIRFLGSRLNEDGLSVLIDADVFESFLVRQNLACVWAFIAERNAWPGGSNMLAAWRRSEGVAWREGGRIRAIHWKNDTDLSKPNSK